MKLSLESLWREPPGTDFLVVLALGLPTALGIGLFSMGSSKWLFFILFLSGCGAVFLSLPQKLRISSLYFILFLSFSIKIDFHLVFLSSHVFRRINGVVICLFDIPFFLLFFFWMVRLIFNPEVRILFRPIFSILFWSIWLLTVFGLSRSIAPSLIKFQEIWTLTECWLMFLLIYNSVKSTRVVLILIFALLASLVLQCLLGYGQYLTGGHLGLEFFGEAEQGFRSMRMGTGFISRVGGTVGSPNKLALYCGMIIPINFALLFSPIRRKIKWFIFAPILLMTLVLEVITYSRGGWVGLAVGGTSTFYFVLARLARRRIISLILVFFLVTTLLGAAIALVPPIQRRLFADDYGTAQTRWPMYQVALNIISHYPFLGVGLDNYTGVHQAFDKTSEAISWNFPMPVHNEFLLIGAEQGLPVLGLFLLIIAAVMVRLVRVCHSRADPILPFVAMGIFGGFITWIIHNQFEFAYVMFDVFFWALIGLSYAMDRIIMLKEQDPGLSHLIVCPGGLMERRN